MRGPFYFEVLEDLITRFQLLVRTGSPRDLQIAFGLLGSIDYVLDRIVAGHT